MSASLRMGQQGDGILRLQGCDAAILVRLDEHARLVLQEAEMLAEGADEADAKGPLALCRMRMRTIVRDMKFYLAESRDLRKANFLPPHVLDQVMGGK